MGDSAPVLLYNGGMKKKKEKILPSDEGRTEAAANKAAVRKKPEKGGKKDKKEQKVFSLPHYILLMAVCFVLRLRFGAKSVLSDSFREQKKNGAMLVLSNHVSAFDFAWFSTPFLGRKVSFVVAETMQYSQPIFAKLIRGYRAIVKKQFYADYTCIKNIKRYLDAGVSVILCPEGKVSADGRTAKMAFAIAKLVKWLGYPVASCVISGAGLTRPKWAHSSRTGGVLCEMDMMMTAEESKTLSAQEVMARIEGALAHNEHVWQAENGRKYRGKKYAEGLENVLYRCPECGREFVMTTSGNAIMCEKCGFSAVYTQTGKILPTDGYDGRCPERIDVWYDEIRESVAAEVSADDFRLEQKVRLMTVNRKGNGYRYAASGTLALDREALTFTASEDEDPERAADAPESLSVLVKNLPTAATLPGVSLDISGDGATYRAVFTSEHASTKFALALEAMAALRGE